jgi:hypothetical protein
LPVRLSFLRAPGASVDGRSRLRSPFDARHAGAIRRVTEVDHPAEGLRDSNGFSIFLYLFILLLFF